MLGVILVVHTRGIGALLVEASSWVCTVSLHHITVVLLGQAIRWVKGVAISHSMVVLLGQAIRWVGGVVNNNTMLVMVWQTIRVVLAKLLLVSHRVAYLGLGNPVTIVVV